MQELLGQKLTISEDGCGSFNPDDTGQPVLTGHDGPVGDESTQLSHDPTQEGEIGTPADVGADGDKDVALKAPGS